MAAPKSTPASRHSIHDLRVPLKTDAGDSCAAPSLDLALADRIRGEFLEMRGFSPTQEQAERLFHLPEEVCRTMLATLVAEGFLRIERDGRFRLLQLG